MKFFCAGLIVTILAMDTSSAFAVKQYSSETGERTWKGFVTGAPRFQNHSSGAAQSAARAGNLGAGGIRNGRARVPQESLSMVENPLFKRGATQVSGGSKRGAPGLSGSGASGSSHPSILHRERAGAMTTESHFPDGTKAVATSYPATKKHSTRLLYPDGTKTHERGTRHDDGSKAVVGVTKSPNGSTIKYSYEIDPQGKRRNHMIHK